MKISFSKHHNYDIKLQVQQQAWVWSLVTFVWRMRRIFFPTTTGTTTAAPACSARGWATSATRSPGRRWSSSGPPLCRARWTIIKKYLILRPEIFQAYTALAIHDYIPALHHAETLLTISPLPSCYTLLAHLYAAESLILQDRYWDILSYFIVSNCQLSTGYLRP